MKRLLISVLVLFLAVCTAAPAYARAHQLPQTKAQRQAQKDWEKWNKQQIKIGKQQFKAQQKSIKNWNKSHPRRSVTG